MSYRVLIFIDVFRKKEVFDKMLFLSVL